MLPNECAAANPVIASRLQSNALVCRVAELDRSAAFARDARERRVEDDGGDFFTANLH